MEPPEGGAVVRSRLNDYGSIDSPWNEAGSPSPAPCSEMIMRVTIAGMEPPEGGAVVRSRLNDYGSIDSPWNEADSPPLPPAQEAPHYTMRSLPATKSGAVPCGIYRPMDWRPARLVMVWNFLFFLAVVER